MILVDVKECPLCHASTAESMFFGRVAVEVPGAQITADYYLCTKCGIFYQQPRWQVDYDEEYRLFTQAIYNEPFPTILVNLTERAVQVVDYADAVLGGLGVKPKFVLDIGAAVGSLSALCKRRFDCDVMGVEPTNEFREWGVKHNKVEMVPYLKDLPEGKDFDVLTCIHVLEHIPEPHAFIDEFPRRRVSPQYLIVETPNAMSLSWGSLWHPLAWSQATLGRRFREHGWSGPSAVNVHAWPMERAENSIQMLFTR